MTKILFKYTRFIIVLGDGLLLNALFVCGYFFNSYLKDDVADIVVLRTLGIVNACWIMASMMQKKNAFYRISGKMRIFRGSVIFLFFHFLLTFTTAGIIRTPVDHSQALIFVYLPALILLPAWRYLVKLLLELKREGGHNLKKVIIIGSGPEAERLGRVFKDHPEFGYSFKGYFDNVKRGINRVRGTVSDAIEYAAKWNVDEIYCAMSAVTEAEADRVIEFAENNFKLIHFIPMFPSKEELQRYRIEYFGTVPIMVRPYSPLEIVANRLIKRTFDVIISFFMILVVLSWLIPVISLLIILDSKGPVFYRQRRSGLNKSVFWCWKFRSMIVCESSEFKQATKNDARVTRIGAILRRTNLDELPQFFNVLIGHMSIIGPRPHPVELDMQYVHQLSGYNKRMVVKPGITGLSQVKGYRGETNEPYLMRNRITFDIFYSQNWSFLFDVKIVLLTIFHMIKGSSRAY